MWVWLYVTVFAVMSPLGIGIGILVIEAQLEDGAFIQAVLEGLAAGTFVYITFLEILPHELNSPERPLLKVLFLLCGFSVMAGLSFLGWKTLSLFCALGPENWSLEEITLSEIRLPKLHVISGKQKVHFACFIEKLSLIFYKHKDAVVFKKNFYQTILQCISKKCFKWLL